MLIRLLVVLLFGFSFVSAQSGNRVQDIYNRLNAKVGLKIPIYVDQNNQLNAWTDGSKIVVLSGLVKTAGNEELAFVIAHEIAHNVYGSNEMGADKGAIIIMNQAGYNACSGGTKFFQHLLRVYGDTSDDVHPPTTYRLKVIKELACH